MTLWILTYITSDWEYYTDTLAGVFTSYDDAATAVELYSPTYPYEFEIRQIGLGDLLLCDDSDYSSCSVPLCAELPPSIPSNPVPPISTGPG